MDSRYFNYTTYYAERGWERSSFIRQWQRIYQTDPRWVALHYRQQQQLRHPQLSPYLQRVGAGYIRLEALPHRKQTIGFGGALWEESVAAAILCVDTDNTGRQGRLALLHVVNDEEALERLLHIAQEELWQMGCRRFIGPTGLSPQLQSGLLNDYFHVIPPLHTPYNPPYLPELISGSLRAQQQTHLYHYDLATAEHNQHAPTEFNDNQRINERITLVPLTANQAQSPEFLPLWQAAVPVAEYAATLAMDEVHFLWQWTTVWPWAGWVAMAAEKPVGFVLLQPDFAPLCRQTGGGQNLFWRGWLSWRQQFGSAQGRLVYGGVLPAWRGQGIGAMLWQQTLGHAHEAGWQTLTIGPLAASSSGANFLQKRGVTAQQRYTLFGGE